MKIDLTLRTRYGHGQLDQGKVLYGFTPAGDYLLNYKGIALQILSQSGAYLTNKIYDHFQLQRH